MPSFLADDVGTNVAIHQGTLPRPPHEKAPLHSMSFPEQPNGHPVEGINAVNGIKPVSSAHGTDVYAASSVHSVPNGRPSATYSNHSRDKLGSRDGSIMSNVTGAMENVRRSPGPLSGLSKSAPTGDSNYLQGDGRPYSPGTWNVVNGEPIETSSMSTSPQHEGTDYADRNPDVNGSQLSPASPSGDASAPQSIPTPLSSSGTSSSPSHKPAAPPQLRHRHTLQVPKMSSLRSSRDYSTPTSDAISASGRFSPTHSGMRRGSLTLNRRPTHSIHSDMHLDEVPPDEDAARWSEMIKNKRASKRRKKEDEDDDRVVVGTKVDQNHVNWVTAYNMLTGIRFTVSRTNAKLDRELTDADFNAKHKFSFDITGNELTPSAKYDFKFKDYAPWVFRHLRAKFCLDPADYLMSLTSKYILSELGSPGKSGSFFYFSRDYKYIIKTIHHSEHKFLRLILKDYYNHVQDNPNTLLSQFYGLHRVKIPYGRKIHFVVMNNLFPPHRDIHRTFDLKGSTIGRDFKEEDLAKNPRATMKDLNWLRRNLHLEFGPTKKDLFIAQMERDVKLLQRLKIMDYSLLVGVHDLEKGNEENLRDKTLRIFQPGGESGGDPASLNSLMRTPSKLETARKAKELREIIKKEKPVLMQETSSRMPDEMLEEERRRHFTFYGDDGGFRATHEDERPGEEIYYLGIIDCLTYYGFLKKAEHFWKGLSQPRSQISPIPPEAYGDRFIKFITGITKTREEAERETAQSGGPSLDGMPRASGPGAGRLSRSSTDRVMEKAERQARKSDSDSHHRSHAPEASGSSAAAEPNTPERVISSVRSPSAERTNGAAGAVLPVVEEAGEAGSTEGGSRERSVVREGEERVQAPLAEGGDTAAAAAAAATTTTTTSQVILADEDDRPLTAEPAPTSSAPPPAASSLSLSSQPHSAVRPSPASKNSYDPDDYRRGVGGGDGGGGSTA